jgi:hypothetical protein
MSRCPAVPSRSSATSSRSSVSSSRLSREAALFRQIARVLLTAMLCSCWYHRGNHWPTNRRCKDAHEVVPRCCPFRSCDRSRFRRSGPWWRDQRPWLTNRDPRRRVAADRCSSAHQLDLCVLWPQPLPRRGARGAANPHAELRPARACWLQGRRSESRSRLQRPQRFPRWWLSRSLSVPQRAVGGVGERMTEARVCGPQSSPRTIARRGHQQTGAGEKRSRPGGHDSETASKPCPQYWKVGSADPGLLRRRTRHGHRSACGQMARRQPLSSSRH